MKKKSRIEIERKIVSRVKREMDKPRLTESVRNGFGAQAAPAIEKLEARYPFCASVIPCPLSFTTLNSNLPNRAQARRSWQASIEFVSQRISRPYARAIAQAGPHSATTCEP